MVEGLEAIDKAKKFLEKTNRCKTCGRKQGDLTISRIPSKTKEEFINFCKEELSNDFGMGIKWLWDFYTGILGKGHERAEAIANEALERIASLESQLAEPTNEEKPVMNVAGKEMKVRKDVKTK